MRIQRSEISNQRYTKYANKTIWLEALDERNPEEALIKFFSKYHSGPNELKMAIDNVKVKFFQELLSCCIETVNMLSKNNNQTNINFTNQILDSLQFFRLFSKELEEMQEKYQKRLRPANGHIQNDKKFIQYFLNFAQQYVSIQPVNNLQKYLYCVERTLENLNEVSTMFSDEQNHLKSILQKKKETPDQTNIQNDEDFQDISLNQESTSEQQSSKSSIYQHFISTSHSEFEDIKTNLNVSSNIHSQTKQEIYYVPKLDNTFSTSSSKYEKKKKFKQQDTNYRNLNKSPFQQKVQVSSKNNIRNHYQRNQDDSRKSSERESENSNSSQSESEENLHKMDPVSVNEKLENEKNQNIEVSYKKCPIEPSFSEFSVVDLRNEVFSGSIFQIPIGLPFKSTEIYLNNHFFILREDYIKNFRKAVSRIKKEGLLQTSVEVVENAFLYHQALVENILVSNKGLQFVITMNVFDTKERKINWKRTRRLMPGSLLLLSCVNLKLMLFGTVLEKPSKDDNGRVSVVVQLIGMKTLQQLQYINMLLSSENQLVVIENQVYFETYTHFLRCLQNIDTKNFPFQDQLVFAKNDMPLPGYLDSKKVRREGIEYDIDLKFNLHSQSQIGRMRRINILRDWNNVNVESLDESQLKAIQIMLKNGISLIQGPPGTGKTFCGALGVRILLQNQFKWNEDYKRMNKPIIIVCQTNHALDQFLQHILTFCRKEDIVRIGGRCKVEAFKDMLLNSNQQQRKVRFSWGEFLHLRETLEKKLRNLLNLIDNVNYQDVEAIIPNLAKLIIKQYLETEDLQFAKQLSNDSRKFIIHMWLDTFKPRKEQTEKIIEIERENGNYTLGNQIRRKDFKVVLQYTQSDLQGQIFLSQQSKEQLEKNLDDDVDEFDGLDSEDEENRKLYGLDDGEKNAFVSHLIQDKKSLKRLLNRLGQDNINSFMNIMEQDLNSPNVKIWEMTQNKRNVITRFIFNQKFQIQFNSLKEKIEEYDEFLQDLKQAYLERDLSYIQTKKIVGVTLAGCAKYAEKFQNLKFNILIIEEAGEVLESKLISVLTKNINHLILIGDHQQLKPNLECYDLECKYRANISLFERLIKNGLEYVTLNEQRRMKTKFANFIRLIYKNYKDHSSISEQNTIQIQGLQEDLLFFNHNFQETQEIFNNSKSNAFEVEMIVKLTNYLLQNKTKASKITVLCTYMKQALKLQSKVKDGIKVQTVDNYQGEENDIIILSLVRSNNRQSLGFVGIDNRVCVAFSRARIGFYVFGDFEFIADCIKEELLKPQHLRKPDTSDLWLKIISFAYSSKVMFDHIPLKCASHNEITKIKTLKDWDNVKGGGCTKPCLQKFPCGHLCDRKCHQSDHRQEDCRRECEKILICGHQCKGECSQKCPPCLVKIEKIMSGCLHKCYLSCSDRNKNIQCFSQCEKQLACGHQCQLKCCDDCNQMVCYEAVTITLTRCKHQMKIKCSDQKYQNQLICQEKCQENLICGHDCSGNCGTCFKKFHSPCTQICDKFLNCGHKCKLLCQLECYQCKEKCQIECNCGDKCLQICDKDCRQCLKPCSLQCEHSKCNKQCFEICDRESCNQRCQKILKCGCQCMGFCGEVCPKICLDSNHYDSQLAIKNTIYYQLECECQLIMEAEAADNYFNSISIKYFIRCPGCDKIMWKSSRYQHKIKEFKKIYYEEKQNKRLKYEVNKDRLEDLKELVMKHLEYVQKNNIKDEMGFLDTILQDIKNNLRLIKDFLDPKFTYQEFMCIKTQLELYQKALILKQAQSEDFLFKHHRQNILQNYLLNEEYRKTFSSFQQWKVEQKLDSLLLYHEFTKLYKDTKKQQYQSISFEIEDSQFFLGEDKNKQLKLLLLETQKN